MTPEADGGLIILAIAGALALPVLVAVGILEEIEKRRTKR